MIVVIGSGEEDGPRRQAGRQCSKALKETKNGNLVLRVPLCPPSPFYLPLPSHLSKPHAAELVLCVHVHNGRLRAMQQKGMVLSLGENGAKNTVCIHRPLRWACGLFQTV
jgi:hypothetical protein